jgi:anti-sigma B factor antagonist
MGACDTSNATRQNASGLSAGCPYTVVPSTASFREVGTIDLVLESRIESGWGVLEVKGEVDLYTSPQLRDKVTELIEQGQSRLVIDLTDVGFMDSSGLGVLVTALKRARERDGALALVCPEGSVHKVLTITGLDRVFPIYGSVGEASAS